MPVTMSRTPSPPEYPMTDQLKVDKDFYDRVFNSGKITSGMSQTEVLMTLLAEEQAMDFTSSDATYTPAVGDPLSTHQMSEITGAGQFWGAISGTLDMISDDNVTIALFTRFSGSMSGALMRTDSDHDYAQVIFEGVGPGERPGAPISSSVSYSGVAPGTLGYNGLIGKVECVGTFGTPETGQRTSITESGITPAYLPSGSFTYKAITGSFPSNYWTSSNVTTGDIAKFSGSYGADSNFTGSIVATTGSLSKCSFLTTPISGANAHPIFTSSYGYTYNHMTPSQDTNRLTASAEVAMTLELAFGFGEQESNSPVNTKHVWMQGDFVCGSTPGSASLKDNLYAKPYLKSIIDGLVFTMGPTEDWQWSGSYISCSIESLPAEVSTSAAVVQRGYVPKSTGHFQPSLAKLSRTRTVRGAQNRYELEQKKKEIQARTGQTPTGRRVTTRRR